MLELQNRIARILRERFPQWGLDQTDIPFSIPPERSLGDLSTTLPFSLARSLRRPPQAIAAELVAGLSDMEGLERVELAKGGFVNFHFQPGWLFDWLWSCPTQPHSGRGKVVVEHTSINPNKSAHIGHLRNACLGDTLARALRWLGYSVEVQNYLDDTGIQVADVIWGLLHHQGKTLDEVRQIPQLAEYLWELYTEVNRIFQNNEAAVAHRNEVHHRMEQRLEPEASLCRYVSEEVLRDHMRVMARLGIHYNLLVRESDIIHLDFWKEAAAVLEEKGIMIPARLEEQAGCRIIPYRRENIDKIIVRSNGTVTYIGKDIAYTLWKVGLFDRDFHYRAFPSDVSPHPLHMTTDQAVEADPHHPEYGHSQRVINVIDVRQSYLQNIISQVLEDLIPGQDHPPFIHYGYEMVALTPRCVRELGFPLSEEDRQKTYVEVSGRKGIAVKANTLLDMLTERSLHEVMNRHQDLDAAAAGRIARAIAVGALRYYMVKFSTHSVIAFDFQEALAFEGDSGPYLQYAMVRINSLLARAGISPDLPDKPLQGIEHLGEHEATAIRELIILLSGMAEQTERSVEERELGGIASLANTIAQKFNTYYHHYPVLSEPDETVRRARLSVMLLVRRHLAALLDILGIPVPERM